MGGTLILNSSVLSSSLINESKNNVKCWHKMWLCSQRCVLKEDNYDSLKHMYTRDGGKREKGRIITVQVNSAYSAALIGVCSV